jgi:hypothetical protein
VSAPDGQAPPIDAHGDVDSPDVDSAHVDGADVDAGDIDGGHIEEAAETFVLSADRWHLEDERQFLHRSLDDARSELEAGDLGQADYDSLCRRDEARLGAVEAALRVLDDEDKAEAVAEATSRRRGRRWLLVVGLAALVAGTTLLAVDVATARAPGQPITGSVKVNQAQQVATQLAQATTLENEGSSSDIAEALIIYAHVLSEDPKQPVALRETGWLEWQNGVNTHERSFETEGTTLVKQSLAVAPNDYAAHLYLGTIDFVGAHDAAAAVVQYRAFFAEQPPAQLIASAASYIRDAYQAAGLPVPAQVPAAAG